jgi:hypothetical protein
MKKVISLITVLLFILQTTYSATQKTYKVSYEEGRIGVELKQKGVLLLGDSSLIFKHSNYSYEIPYADIQSIKYSEKKKQLKMALLEAFLPTPVKQATRPQYGTFSKHEYSPIVIIATLVALVILFVSLLASKSKNAYMSISFEKDGVDNWAIFKIKRKESQSLLLSLSSKSRIKVEEIF